MSRRMRTYYYAIFGALGCLLGWQVSNWVGLSLTSNLYLSDAITGAFLGLALGLALGAARGGGAPRPPPSARAPGFRARASAGRPGWPPARPGGPSPSARCEPCGWGLSTG